MDTKTIERGNTWQQKWSTKVSRIIWMAPKVVSSIISYWENSWSTGSLLGIFIVRSVFLYLCLSVSLCLSLSLSVSLSLCLSVSLSLCLSVSLSLFLSFSLSLPNLTCLLTRDHIKRPQLNLNLTISENIGCTFSIVFGFISIAGNEDLGFGIGLWIGLGFGFEFRKNPLRP